MKKMGVYLDEKESHCTLPLLFCFSLEKSYIDSGLSGVEQMVNE